MRDELSTESVKLAPPATVAAAHYLLGFSLADWVSLLTIVYMLLLIAGWFWKAWKEHKQARSYRRRSADKHR